MKKIALILTAYVFLISCNSKKGGNTGGPHIPVVPDSVNAPRVFARFLKPDSTIGIDFLWCKIGRSIDSNDKVVKDTFFGLPRYVTDTAIDAATKKPIYDSIKNEYVMLTLPVLDRMIRKDSVQITNLECIPLDSITKRSTWNKKYK